MSNPKTSIMYVLKPSIFVLCKKRFLKKIFVANSTSPFFGNRWTKFVKEEVWGCQIIVCLFEKS
jgi:hypothetical protein